MPVCSRAFALDARTGIECYTVALISSDVAVVDRPGFNPFRWLRSQDEYELVITRLPASCGGAAVWRPQGEKPAILLDATVPQIERNENCCHEVGHIENPSRPDPWIDRWVARQLIPWVELDAMHKVAVVNELPAEPWQIAEKMHVRDTVAESAMRQYLKGERW